MARRSAARQGAKRSAGIFRVVTVVGGCAIFFLLFLNTDTHFTHLHGTTADSGWLVSGSNAHNLDVSGDPDRDAAGGESRNPSESDPRASLLSQIIVEEDEGGEQADTLPSFSSTPESSPPPPLADTVDWIKFPPAKPAPPTYESTTTTNLGLYDEGSSYLGEAEHNLGDEHDEHPGGEWASGAPLGEESISALVGAALKELLGGDTNSTDSDSEVEDSDDSGEKVNVKPFTGNFLLTSKKWKTGDVLKMPKYLGKEGQERRKARGKDHTKTIKWDHIGKVSPSMSKVMPEKDPVRSAHKRMYQRCAVIGNGGGLLLAQQGPAIDAHDAVMRFNGGPVTGFETFVGTRTTWRLTNFDHFAFNEKAALAPEVGILQHITAAPALAKLSEYCGKGRKDDPPMFVIDPEFHYFAFNAFGLGAPSNGFYGALLAAEQCQQVTLFGFQKEWRGQQLPYHYYNEIEPNDSQSDRDKNEAARFKSWVRAVNAHARQCTANPSCTDERVNKTMVGNRIMYGEQLVKPAEIRRRLLQL